MTVHEMQKAVDDWIGQFEEGYFSPEIMILRLTEELGELAREVNHLYGPKKKKATEAETSLALELGDLLFVLVSFANSLNLDLEAAFDAVMVKFRTRDQTRWTLKPTQRSASANPANSGHQKGSEQKVDKSNDE
ncbi:MAG: nucleotide pyrophosphohydrolase [Firmicutes bacterium]|nr:nucleotide pyrophosphohydrolase [Bacillota bacterium]